MGFAEPSRSPGLLVSSYLAVSPLPRPRGAAAEAVCFLWHFPYPGRLRGRNGGRYPPSHPVEPGLSSVTRPRTHQLAPVGFVTGTGARAPRRSSGSPRPLNHTTAARDDQPHEPDEISPFSEFTFPCRARNQVRRRLPSWRRRPRFGLAAQGAGIPGRPHAARPRRLRTHRIKRGLQPQVRGDARQAGRPEASNTLSSVLERIEGPYLAGSD